MTSVQRESLDRAIAALNAGDLESYVRLYTDDAALHFLPSSLPPGVQGARLYYGAFMAAFSDMHIDLAETVQEGESLAVRFVLTGTHTGVFNGVPASGRSVRTEGITIMRFAGDRVVERWSTADFVSVLQQVGALPA